MSWTHKGKTAQSRSLNRDDKSYMDETKKSFFDSGHADSGVLSGSNLVSDCCSSGEISPPPERRDKGTSVNKSVSARASDSGVDITDQFSSLDIDGGIPTLKVEDFDQLKQYFEPDEDGDSPIHRAVIKNSYQELRSLVQMISEPRYLDIRNDMRQTALHLAVLTSQVNMVKLLVAAGAATDSVDHHGNTPLHLATVAGDLDLVKELTLSPAGDVIKHIGLKYKPRPRPSILPEINMYNYEGLACIHLALMGGSIALLKHLTWLGANINAGELKGGLTPMHMASTMGDVGLVRTLVRDLCANPCPLSYAGQSPYLLARDSRVQSTMINCLLELGSSCLGDSEDEDEDHVAAHYYTDSEDEDVQMLDRSINNIRDFPVGIAV